jgi:hypothetical protein
MWKYFLNLFSTKSLPENKHTEKAEQAEETNKQKNNYCLFVSKSDELPTEYGIFFSSLGPGIKDCRLGMLYIAPEEYVLKRVSRHSAAGRIKNVIFEYYGIDPFPGSKKVNKKEHIFFDELKY